MAAKNPIIPGFHPDPSICRVGDDYYVATSSFTYFPGVPIFHSRNLVDWQQIGNVLDRPSQLDLVNTSWSSAGVFAPTLRYHGGQFWMITTVAANGRLTSFYVTAADPAGPWSDPLVVDVTGIDPDIAWDEEGSCWVHFAGFQGMARCRIDDRTGELLDEPELVWGGTGMQSPEAPHIFQRGTYWYLMIAEGGTERGHAVSIARGPSVRGPWEPHPQNPILSHRSLPHPIQNTGHADLVEAPDGRWWMVALGVRPKGRTPWFHVLGRETFLAPVTWVDDWPVVGRLELELPDLPQSAADARADSVHDDFDDRDLAPRWLSVRRPAQEFADLEARPGWLRICGGDAGLDSALPSFVARRQQHHNCKVRTIVDTTGETEAGLAVYMDDSAHYAVAVVGDTIRVSARIGPLTSIVSEVARPSGAVVLGVQIVEDDNAPDYVKLGFEDGSGSFVELASLDGRYLSTEVVGGFIGRTIGMYSVNGAADFDWFSYSEIRQEGASGRGDER